tara:strand:+ start:1687 stop:2190 length:504 start_codon:yes stop_codon:yes gene_type:complete
MSIVLLISDNDVKEFTSLNGNVDPDFIMPQIMAAQDVEIERLLGTKLINKLKSDVNLGILSGEYETLVDKYVKPCLAWYTMAYLTPFQAYQISNQGLYKHQSESSITPDKSEVDYIREKSSITAQHYANRMIKYICANSTDFPEYNQLEEGGKWSDKTNQSFGGINF